MNRTVAKEQGGVNNKIGGVACGEGITGPYAKDVAKECDTVWRFSWVQAKGIVGSGSEPDGIGSRVESGRLQESEGPRRRTGRGFGGQAQMGEDLGNHHGTVDGGDDRYGQPQLLFQI